MTKKIESEVIKRLQALNPETVRLDEMNRVVTLIGWTLSEKLPDTYSDENKGKDIETRLRFAWGFSGNQKWLL